MNGETDRMECFLDDLWKLAHQKPDHVVLVDRNGSRSTTLREFEDIIRRTASKVSSMGFPRGSFLIIRMSRCMEYIAAYYGSILAGLAVVPTVPEYPEERIEYIRENCESPFTIEDGFFDDICDYEPSDGVHLEPTDIVCMNYTSGSTGKPKGVYYSLRCLNENIRNAAHIFDGLSEINMAAAASLAFAAMCNDVLSPINIGATVHLLSDEARKDVVLMMRYYEQHHITCGTVAPRLLKHFRHTKGLRRVFSTGERVVNAWSPDHEIWCVYGLTENFTVAAGFKIDRPYENTPIGKPFGPVKIQILDPEGAEVPDGTEGEIHVTWYMAEGYYKMPEETARCFKDLGGGLKRFSTHDLGYRNKNGDIVYVNRMDWMVKISGQRIEPSEVEAAIRSVDGISAAVVQPFEDKSGSAYLCAFYTEEKGTVTEETIRAIIARRLPPYMMPSYFVRMESFPLTVSGKIDRKRLEPPARTTGQSSYVAPVSETERSLCEAMAKVLNLDKVGRHDDFFLMGGSSIDVIELISVIDSDTLRTADVTAGRTPEGIAALMSRTASLDVSHDDECRKKSFSLTPYQMHYYRYWQYAPDVVLGNTPVLLRFEKASVSVERLQKAILDVLRHHPVFCTHIGANTDGDTVQCFDPDMIRKPEVISVTERDLNDRVSSLVRPFVLDNQPLYRCTVLSSEKAEYVFFDAHHIITDHGSQVVFFRDLQRCLEGQNLIPDYYCSYLERLRSIRSNAGNIIAPDATYCRYPAFDKTGSGCLTGIFYVRMSERPPKGTDVSDLLIATALRTLGKYNDCGKACVNWIYGGRDSRVEQDICGLLLSVIPVPVDLEECPDRDSLVRKVREINAWNINYSALAPGFYGERPVIDDSLTVNYIPYHGTERTEGRCFTAKSLITGNSANSEVFYLIAEETSPDEPLLLEFKYNSSFYLRDSMRAFMEMYMKELDLGCWKIEREV